MRGGGEGPCLVEDEVEGVDQERLGIIVQVVLENLNGVWAGPEIVFLLYSKCTILKFSKFKISGISDKNLKSKMMQKELLDTS